MKINHRVYQGEEDVQRVRELLSENYTLTQHHLGEVNAELIRRGRVFGISRGEGLDAPTCWGCDAANPNKFGLPSHLPREIPESHGALKGWAGNNLIEREKVMDEQTSNQEAILARYADGPRQLEAAIAGLSEDKLDIAQSDDAWTIRQIVHHLADGDDIWKVFIKRAIGNTGGEFDLAWYWEMPQDKWARSWRYASRAIEQSLALFRSSRAHIVQLLECVPDAWERSIPIRGPNGEKQDVSIGWVVEMQARHVTGHLDDIRKTLSGGN